MRQSWWFGALITRSQSSNQFCLVLPVQSETCTRREKASLRYSCIIYSHWPVPTIHYLEGNTYAYILIECLL